MVWEECLIVVDCFAILFCCTIIFRRKEIDVAIVFRGHIEGNDEAPYGVWA
jgi:hypothetical protein